jgi:hypothetical protein
MKIALVKIHIRSFAFTSRRNYHIIPGHKCEICGGHSDNGTPCPPSLSVLSRQCHSVVQCSGWFVAGGAVCGAGGRAYWVWGSGEGCVFICLKPQCDKFNCTYGGVEGQTEHDCRCTSDSLLAYRL